MSASFTRWYSELRRRRMFKALALSVIVGWVTLTEPAPVPRPQADARSIAVLPFVDMSADRDQESLGDSVAEEILNVGVAAVLEGSIRKAGNRIRNTTQLIDVANGYHLWSERFDRELDDIFAIQDQIAESVARALK